MFEIVLFILLVAVSFAFIFKPKLNSGKRAAPPKAPTPLAPAKIEPLGSAERFTKMPAPRQPAQSEPAHLYPPQKHKDHAPPPPVPASRQLKGRAYVIDGDTIAIERIKIRLAGIDAPELDQPWGQKSKWAMVRLCKGQTIRVELTGETSYDRLVGTCYLPDGRDIGAEIIKQGLALDGGHYSKGKYRHLEPDGVRQKLRFYGRWR
ncbi:MULTISPECIES: thermonuclease family protein [Roseobacteraceae]|jgi:endonuclease YncB( thermonuclease family)|uniref:Nuclease n=1 Tax=Pseudosulfitobacter pseudonitzschiae TaxID=1402135 RepID=A0A221K317_9RHOB|nr:MULTISPECIES: thermonuclease family protein [Roseobacteraceae]ASM73398.1 nuclease [Pseudosulfitobacter pseudonitzschiae]